MVVETRDPLAAYDGLAPDAEGDMPEDDALQAVPEGTDESDPSFVDDTDEAATEDDADDEETAALKAEIRAAAEAEITANLTQKFQQDINNLRRSLESQNTQLRKQSQRLQREADLRERWFKQYLSEAQAGERIPDERDYFKFKDDLNTAGAAAELTEQQKIAAYQQWSTATANKMATDLLERSKDENGNQLFDPQHPELMKLAAAGHYWAEQAVLHDNATAAQNSDQAFDALKSLRDKLWAEGVKRVAAQKRQTVNKETQAVRQKQRERGVQSTARGSGAGGAADFLAFHEQAKREMPDGSKDDIYLRAMELKARALAPQPRR